MPKLIIQIPCFNEEEALPITLSSLPRAVEGFDAVEILVIDDGSTDGTVRVAREHGTHHVVSLGVNQGLARAFMVGIETSLLLGADVIVNTDGDNQYSAECIPDLVAPILRGEALIVVGARPIAEIEHFSLAKKFLQRLGSWAVKIASGTRVEDAPSGFRAFHRDAAIRLNVFGNYTYTLETIILAGRRNLRIVSVPIRVNGYLRPSRLMRSVPQYVRQSLLTIIRIFILYKPLRFFATVAMVLAIPAMIVVIRFLYFYLVGEGEGHVQSLVLATALFAISAIVAIGGLLADLVAANRTLLEDVRARMLQIQSDKSARPR